MQIRPVVTETPWADACPGGLIPFLMSSQASPDKENP
jgi:hypothetical protein